MKTIAELVAAASFVGIAGCALLVGIAGCDEESPEKRYCLPPGAINVRELGNDWHLFDLEIHGRNYTFLHRVDGTGGHAIAEVHRR